MKTLLIFKQLYCKFNIKIFESGEFTDQIYIFKFLLNNYNYAQATS